MSFLRFGVGVGFRISVAYVQRLKGMSTVRWEDQALHSSWIRTVCMVHRIHRVSPCLDFSWDLFHLGLTEAKLF